MILIEGDNGTGKDALANDLHYTSISRLKEIRKLEDYARSIEQPAQMWAFLYYNEICARHAQTSDSICVLIRYWPSTISAAYADGFIDGHKLDDMISLCRTYMVQPKVVFWLKCEFNTRISRINMRRENQPVNSIDSLCHERAKRHAFAMARILNDFPSVCAIDNTNYVPSQTSSIAYKYLQGQGYL